MESFFPDEPLSYKRTDIDHLHAQECKACPLALIKANVNPHMPATGAESPLVYMLGEAPGEDEDEENEQFVGMSGQLLRARIPRAFKGKLRFNNVVRTRPPKNRNPTWQEMECCRPSIVRDIEQSKPQAIFGFGNVPLDWVCGFSGIKLWRGRRMPVRIGTHTCWYFPMLHPAFILRNRRLDVPSEEMQVFKLDLERAFDIVEKLPTPVVHTPQDVWRNLECITDSVVRVEEMLKWAAEQPNVGIDYETNCIRPYSEGAKVLTAAVATGKIGFAFPIDHPESQWSPKERERVVELWVDFLRKGGCTKYVHMLAFELEWTGVMFGADLVRAGKWECTATQACILDERKGKQKPGCFSLEFLVQQYFGFNLKQMTNLDRANLSREPLDVVLRYNAGDARYHCLLGLAQSKLIKEEGLQEAYVLGRRRVPTVVLTQMKGVPVDQEECVRLQKKYKKRIAQLEAEIMEIEVVKEFGKNKGVPFQPFSNKDVIYVFKDMLGREECVVLDKYTKKIKYSADEEILEKIDHPLATKLIQLRKANKRKSTYIDPKRIGDEKSLVYPDGLLHPTFNTIFSEAGRLSCDGPNLQNEIKREEEGRECRKQLKAAKQEVIVAFDYGQIEARVIAMFTKDKAFCKALWEDYDVHMEWAERIARAYPARVGGTKNFTDKKVMKDFRTDIKNQWTFPLFFGAKMESAAGYLNIPVEKIRKPYNEFWRQFSGVKQWQEELFEFYLKYGYVEGLTGRRRRAPLSLNKVLNSPVQGTAAEIVMDGMCRLSEIGDPDLQPEINIHDDLTFCRVPLKRVDEIAARIITEMLAVPFPWVNVPITVEMSFGPNWLDMEELEDGASTFRSDRWFK